MTTIIIIKKPLQQKFQTSGKNEGGMKMEKTYIGTKIITAEEMDECSFLKKIRGGDVSNRETRPGHKVRYEDGYISWSPKDVFERSYRLISDSEVELLFSTIPCEAKGE
jgi:hypothetical protein